MDSKQARAFSLRQCTCMKMCCQLVCQRAFRWASRLHYVTRHALFSISLHVVQRHSTVSCVEDSSCSYNKEYSGERVEVYLGGFT